ncbi:MAG TPA: RnfABCDGE type electron transport complex subunit C [Spirochaetia bacterium]|nr:RnfABCDGE type electron transport complex subunit C [Spirochaetia bacterium]
MKSFASLRNGGLRLKELGIEHDRIRNAVIPAIAVFPLLQHSGLPAECLVRVGDRVDEGMLIARGSGTLSAAIHSSIPGVVTARRTILLPNGRQSDSVAIKLEGEFARQGRVGVRLQDGARPSQETLLDLIREQGLVSLDTDAIPLHVLWKLPKGKHLESLIVNALNDEPYLTVEHKLSRERSDALSEGLAIAIEILRPRHVIFVSEQTDDEEVINPAVASSERAAVTAGVTFTSSSIGSRYPRGERRELVRMVTGKNVPAGASILDLGVLVTNTSTLVAVRDAISGGKPLIERSVSVAGGAIADPATLRVRIGTRIQDLLEECGGLTEVPDRILVGGPITGDVVYDLDTPIMKSTSAIIALSEREAEEGRRLPCISCGRCLSSCPEGLNPARLFKQIEHGQPEKAVAAGLLECTECGSCSVVCPSHIPLLYGLRLGKRTAQREGEIG